MKSSPPANTPGLLAWLCFVCSPVLAENVTLTANDGESVLEGALISSENGILTVETGVGTFSIPASAVSCAGPGCPTDSEDTPPAPTSEKAVIESSPSEEPSPEPPAVRIVGADIAIERMLPDMLDAYRRTVDAELGRGGSDAEGWVYSLNASAEPPLRISAFSGGSQQGVADLIAGEADVAIVSRPMTEAEAASLLPGGLSAMRAAGLERILAADGMVVVADASVGVTSLKLEDVARVFSGEILNWSALGGPDLAITPFVREQGSATREVFEELVLAPFERSVAGRAIGVDNDKGIADAVVAFPGSIGVTSYYSAAGARAMDLEDTCGLVVGADPFAMQTGRYPLTRYLYAYVAPDAPDALVDGLLAFLQSQAGQEALSEMGYIGQRITSEGLEAQRARLAVAMATPPKEALLAPLRNMVETLIAAERISPTFRRGAPRGGDVLAAEQGQRLAEEIADGTYDGRELMFVGFTDPAAPAAEVALGESLAEAEAIRAAVLSAAPGIADNTAVRLSALGYGGLAPLACEATAFGRDINRRVEVWTRPLPGTE